MERLTYMNGGKWCIRMGDTEYSGEKVNRISAYEDLLDGCDIDHILELVEADRDGRCVVLSEPMKPMVYKTNDTDVYCPNCGNTLSGGWPLSDADDERKMVQCFHCGQAIDDTKVEAAAKEQ
ncbi:hypothetical protein [Angelakisella massiliensis]|uniref:hypothetical protein n=1 Tax=Angelakisella massiliensis TaxID=1871018 RepID=UPI0023A7F5DB|nr:hypothetical protein [Angelakisella massiliensis]